MISTNEGYIRLEYFSEDVAADKNRKEFDIKNHTLCYTNQRPDFLFIGDSITEYWELNAYFRNSDQLIINRGIAGDTTKYLKKRFYVDAVQLKPKYCILGIGINDSIEVEGDYWKKIEPVPYSVDQHIIIWHFRRIKLCRNNAGIFHPRTPGILVITVIEKIITVITRLKMGYFNFPDSANYGIK